VGSFLLRGGTLHGRWRALGKGEHTTLLSFARGWGALEERGTPSLVGGTLERRELLQGQGKGKARLKIKQRQGQSKGTRKRVKGKLRKKGAPRQRVPCFKRLAGRSSRNSKASEKGCYCNRFTCLCFPCCTFCFEAFYIHLLQTGFPHGGVFQGHVDQKHMCQFHACLEV
jgi:hypothetical protein